MAFTYQYHDQGYTVELQANADGSYTAVVNGCSYAVQAVPIADGGLRLTLNGERFTVYTAAQGNQRHVSVGGNSYTLTVPDARTARRRGASAGGDLTAQMPGQIVAVLVAEGDMVTRGQPLVILEAMKMEIRATAPSDGQVKRLLVQKGDVVERGQRLVEIEETNSG